MSWPALPLFVLPRLLTRRAARRTQALLKGRKLPHEARVGLHQRPATPHELERGLYGHVAI
eukprot:317454-Prymnesium_polylepis.1